MPRLIKSKRKYLLGGPKKRSQLDSNQDNRTVLTSDEEYVYQKWYASLPKQYQTPGTKENYETPSSYDIRGNWRDNEGEYEMNPDGFYHMPSFSGATGKFLKTPDNSESFINGLNGMPKWSYPGIDIGTGQLQLKRKDEVPESNQSKLKSKNKYGGNTDNDMKRYLLKRKRKYVMAGLEDPDVVNSVSYGDKEIEAILANKQRNLNPNYTNAIASGTGLITGIGTDIYENKNQNTANVGAHAIKGMGSGFSSGAMVGTMLGGPAGTLIGGGIGAGLGLVEGLYSGFSEKKQMKQDDIENKQEEYNKSSQDLIEKNQHFGLNQGFLYGGFAMGGGNNENMVNFNGGDGTQDSVELGNKFVDNGETETKKMNEKIIHSNAFVITPEMAQQYNIPSKYIGKTPADVSKLMMDTNLRMVFGGTKETLDMTKRFLKKSDMFAKGADRADKRNGVGLYALEQLSTDMGEMMRAQEEGIQQPMAKFGGKMKYAGGGGEPIPIPEDYANKAEYIQAMYEYTQKYGTKGMVPQSEAMQSNEMMADINDLKANPNNIRPEVDNRVKANINDLKSRPKSRFLKIDINNLKAKQRQTKGPSEQSFHKEGYDEYGKKRYMGNAAQFLEGVYNPEGIVPERKNMKMMESKTLVPEVVRPTMVEKGIKEKEGTFNEEFKKARESGQKTFKWHGKLYGTELKKSGNTMLGRNTTEGLPLGKGKFHVGGGEPHTHSGSVDGAISGSGNAAEWGDLFSTIGDMGSAGYDYIINDPARGPGQPIQSKFNNGPSVRSVRPTLTTTVPKTTKVITNPRTGKKEVVQSNSTSAVATDYSGTPFTSYNGIPFVDGSSIGSSNTTTPLYNWQNKEQDFSNTVTGSDNVSTVNPDGTIETKAGTESPDSIDENGNGIGIDGLQAAGYLGQMATMLRNAWLDKQPLEVESPEQLEARLINLSEQRRQASKLADKTRNIGLLRSRSTGNTKGAFMSNANVQDASVQDTLGNQLGQSYLTEETTNKGIQSATDRANAAERVRARDVNAQRLAARTNIGTKAYKNLGDFSSQVGQDAIANKTQNTIIRDMIKTDMLEMYQDSKGRWKMRATGKEPTNAAEKSFLASLETEDYSVSEKKKVKKMYGGKLLSKYNLGI